MTGANFSWVTLCDASGRLTAQFGFNGIEMVSRAVHSGEVPVRALKDHIDTIPARIETKITSEMSIDILFSSVVRDRFSRILWQDVEVDWTRCLTYCKANLIPSSSIASTQHPPRGRPMKIGGAIQDMKLAIDKNEISREKLKAMKGKELAHLIQPVWNLS